MHETRVALVTGANKGIGLQIAKDLAARGFTVLVGSRKLDRGEVAARTVGHGARAVQLDVTSASSITGAAERIRTELGRLDVLVNNAAISKVETSDLPFDQLLRAHYPSVVPLDDVRTIFETNVLGVLAVTQAMLPLLREAPAGRIVNVSSSVGSLATQMDPSNPYPFPSGSYAVSKSALNALTVAFALELKDTRIKVNAACPGYTATDLNLFQGTRSVEQGAREPVRLALLDDDGLTGSFSNEDGPLPW